MNKISLVTTGRDDDYEGDFLTRMRASLTHNCNLLKELDLDYEYVVVEWSPFRDFLYYNEKTKDIFQGDFNIKNVIVDRSVADAENLNPEKYFEYFANNAGIRRSNGDILLMINTDILITPGLGQEIKDLIDTGIDKGKFYRTRYRQRMNLGESEPYDTTDLHNPAFSDACICGGYSGDFLLSTRHAIVDVAHGYNESDPDHRVTFQTGMDGEILWNMYHNGIRLEFLNEPYIHLQHSKNREYDGYKEGIKYDNKPDWGFINYKLEEVVPDRLEVIKV